MNREWILRRTPPGPLPVPEDYSFRETELPEPALGQMLTRTIYLSLDPYQWGRQTSGGDSAGAVCHGRTVSQVMKSRIAGYAEGDYVFNTNGWQSHGLTGEGIPVYTYMFPRKLDPAAAPISTAVGVLGMLGLTAYSGMVVQLDPKPGETVVVSAASGGVGQNAVQLAKIRGARVVGIAGSAEKCRFVTDGLGADECVSHLGEDFPARLAAACPRGIDAYFENVGGRVFGAALALMKTGSRLSLCGVISQWTEPRFGPGKAGLIEFGRSEFARKSITVHDLVVGSFVATHQAKFLEDMAGWVKDGRVKYRDDLHPGLENTPKVFRALLEGGTFGKTLVGVGEDPTRAGPGPRARAA